MGNSCSCSHPARVANRGHSTETTSCDEEDAGSSGSSHVQRGGTVACQQLRQTPSSESNALIEQTPSDRFQRIFLDGNRGAAGSTNSQFMIGHQQHHAIIPGVKNLGHNDRLTTAIAVPLSSAIPETSQTGSMLETSMRHKTYSTTRKNPLDSRRRNSELGGGLASFGEDQEEVHRARQSALAAVAEATTARQRRNMIPSTSIHNEDLEMSAIPRGMSVGGGGGGGGDGDEFSLDSAPSEHSLVTVASAHSSVMMTSFGVDRRPIVRLDGKSRKGSVAPGVSSNSHKRPPSVASDETNSALERSFDAGELQGTNFRSTADDEEEAQRVMEGSAFERATFKNSFDQYIAEHVMQMRTNAIVHWFKNAACSKSELVRRHRSNHHPDTVITFIPHVVVATFHSDEYPTTNNNTTGGDTPLTTSIRRRSSLASDLAVLTHEKTPYAIQLARKKLGSSIFPLGF